SFSFPTKRNLPRTRGRGVGPGGGAGTSAGATAALARPGATRCKASLRSGPSLVEPPEWLGTMRRIWFLGRVVCERRSKLAVSPQAACRMQAGRSGVRELHGARTESHVTIRRRMCCRIAAVRPGGGRSFERAADVEQSPPRDRITRLVTRVTALPARPMIALYLFC